MRFAFIINVPRVTPETYSTVFETPGSYNLVAGVDGMDVAKEYIKKLTEDGFERINLSGDFEEETVEELCQLVGEGVEIRRAQYTIDEMIKTNFIDSVRDYGLIIQVEDAEKPRYVVLRSEVCDTRVIFVKDMRQARNAGRKLIEKRVDFIELSDWFDILRLFTMVKETENKVPVGTCGELDPSMLE